MNAPASTKPVLDLSPNVDAWNALGELPPGPFSDVRCRMVLEGCKWDPQVGDVATLAPFPLVIPSGVACTLGALAERLSAEAVDAERVIFEHPECLRTLSLPRAVRRALVARADLTPAAARVIRYDFHPTPDGWRISEANADVPGGYTESSLFPRLMAEHCPGTITAGDPAAALAEAIVATVGHAGTVGLLAATGHMEDQQVIAFLAGILRRKGCATIRAHPRQVAWNGGCAALTARRGKALPVDALVRFYQAECLPTVSPRSGWLEFFRGGRTPVCNPGTSLVIESKRFPLVWDRLGLELPTWRRLLPPTCDPRSLHGRFEPGWVLKTAFCNTGETVAMAGDRTRWKNAVWSARLRPDRWIAQRCFETLPLATPRGLMYPCVGVYTVNGRAAGLFGRLAFQPLIDLSAIEAAVLIDPLK